MHPTVFEVVWNEDSTPTALGRITARDGTGVATGRKGEGNWLKQADISSITVGVFDLDADSTIVSAAVVDKTASVLDVPVTTDVLWTRDKIGYNFIHDLSVTYFATGDHTFLVEYKVTLTGGTVFFGRYQGPASSVRTS